MCAGRRRAWLCERSPLPRPGGLRGRRRPSCLAEAVSVCAARRRWPGSEGRRLRLVTSERAIKERGAPPRPGWACSPPPPAAAPPPPPARELPPSRPALPCRVRDGLSRLDASWNSGAVIAGAESRVQAGPRVRYGERGGGLGQQQQPPSEPPRLRALD